MYRDLKSRYIASEETPVAQKWSLEEPRTLDLTGVRRLSLRIVSGEAEVVASEGVETARVELHELDGPPLRVELDDHGVLTVAHEKLTWGGLLDWITGPHKASAHVSVSLPAGVDVELGVVDADATVSGVTGATAVKSVSGEVTLDGCSGEIAAQTVSGSLESRDLEGRLRFTSVSGELTVVGGSTTGVRAESVSGGLVLDLLEASGDLALKTVSGDVTVRLPTAPSVEVDTVSVSGRMTASGYALTDDGKPGRRRMRGSIGAGDTKLQAKTVSGDVTLLARDA
jgi:hypothetical protein